MRRITRLGGLCGKDSEGKENPNKKNEGGSVCVVCAVSCASEPPLSPWSSSSVPTFGCRDVYCIYFAVLLLLFCWRKGTRNQTLRVGGLRGCQSRQTCTGHVREAPLYRGTESIHLLLGKLEPDVRVTNVSLWESVYIDVYSVIRCEGWWGASPSPSPTPPPHSSLAFRVCDKFDNDGVEPPPWWRRVVMVVMVVLLMVVCEGFSRGGTGGEFEAHPHTHGTHTQPRMGARLQASSKPRTACEDVCVCVVWWSCCWRSLSPRSCTTLAGGNLVSRSVICVAPVAQGPRWVCCVCVRIIPPPRLGDGCRGGSFAKLRENRVVFVGRVLPALS